MESRPEEPIMNTAKRLRWPFLESEMSGLLANIERYKSNFQLAISVDNMSQMQQLLGGTVDALAGVKHLKTEIRAIAQQQREEREDFLRRQRESTHREILKFLSPTNYSMNHKVASKLQHEGTGRWFLEEIFQTWLKRDKSFLWVHGIAGAGKTILASMAIDEVQSYCRLGYHRLAYFYCDFKDASHQDPSNILGSTIGQLVMQGKEVPESLQDLYEKSSGGKERPSLQSLLDLLAEIVGGPNKPPCTYIVVDALDECTEREGLLAGLVELHLLVIERAAEEE
ncbi:MAG: hypothetical protein M1839_004627 [Geoglossum umbratile]|nr:MAG: hypothetical protein M1839_004627 [Geoglossum umbratile]